jgi:hypothetical protein
MKNPAWLSVLIVIPANAGMTANDMVNDETGPSPQRSGSEQTSSHHSLPA